MITTTLVVSLTFLQQISPAISGGGSWGTPKAPSLGCCITDCYGRPNGDYQSCYGCEYYATCAGGKMTSPNPTISFYDRRPCGAPGIGLVWDDNKKRCEWTSDTCDPQNDNCNEQCESNLPEHFPPAQGCAPICETADYLIILDGSGSVPYNDFTNSLTWLKDIIANNIPDTANVAALQFASGYRWIHEFGETQSPRDTMNTNIDNTNKINGGTNIGQALQVGIAAISQQSATEKIIILLTDGIGSSNSCTLNNPVPADISVYVVGLNNADPTGELGCLDPPAVDIVTISNFDFSVVTDTLVACEAICYGEE